MSASSSSSSAAAMTPGPPGGHAPVRWGIVGAGAIAGRFARDLAHVPEARLAAVFARRAEAARLLAGAHAARPVTSLADLFASGLDAIYVATHPDTHHAFSRAALTAGLPVLCEKPVTRSLAELEDLLRLAHAQKLLFMEAMKTPFLPLYAELRTALRSVQQARSAGDRGSAGTVRPLGPIAFVQAGNAAVATPPAHPSWSAALAGGALLSIGVYQAFLAVDWLGPAAEVQALAHLSTGAATPVDSFTLVQSRHRDGLSQLYAGLAQASPGTAMLAAADGFVTIHKPWWTPSRATLFRADGAMTELHAPGVGDGLHYEAAHFCALLRSGRLESPVVSHAHSRAVMHLLDRARAAVGLRFPGEPPSPA